MKLLRFLLIVLMVALVGCSDTSAPKPQNPDTAKKQDALPEFSEKEAAAGLLPVSIYTLHKPGSSDNAISEIVLHGKAEDKDLKWLGGRKHLAKLELDSCKGVTDVGMRSVSQLPALQQLALRDTGVTDAGLVEVAKVKDLIFLELKGSFTDAGLKEIGRLKNLRTLTLHGDFTDAGIKELADMTELVVLNLGNTKIKGEGLDSFKKLKLYHLSLPPSVKNDVGMRHYLRLVNFTESTKKRPHLAKTAGFFADFSGWDVTDTALSGFALHKELNHIDLSNTKITGTGLSALKNMTDLETLRLDNCPLTPAGFEALGQVGNTNIKSLFLIGVKVDVDSLKPFMDARRPGKTRITIDDDAVAKKVNSIYGGLSVSTDR